MNALHDAWQRTVRRCGDARAVVEAASAREVTFRELERGAAAYGFESRVLAGRAVVFAQPNGAAWLELFLALVRAGAVVTPLDAAEPPVEQRRIAESLRAGYWWDGQRLVTLPNARRYRDSSVALIKLTSGTTGLPRALPFTACQMLTDGRQVTLTMGIRRADTNYALIPFGHSYGLGNLTLPLVSQGIPLVCGSAALPQAIAEDFARWRPTVFPSVPAVFRALSAADVDGASFASLGVAISAGAPLPPEVAQEFARRFGRRIHAFYGSSETGGIAYDRDGSAALAGGVGRPMRGVRVTPAAGGRIRVTSTAVFTAGNRRREGRAGSWIPPDRVSIDGRGNITLLGRRGTTVKIAGRRVNLVEVLDRLRRIPGVRDAWVGTNSAAEPVLGAAVVTSLAAPEIRSRLLTDIAPWKTPKKWIILAELPLTERGKADTRALHRAVFG